MSKLLFCAPIVILAGVTMNNLHADPTDAIKINQLEQDVRELQRTVQQQARRIEVLETAARQAGTGTTRWPRLPAPSASKDNSTPMWLRSEHWERLRPGMTEADVINTLGPPTTTRKSPDNDTQTLFYARELEAGGFLSGQVVIENQRVREIHRPTLK